MQNALRARIASMRSRLDGQKTVTAIPAQSQLFVSPPPVCQRLTELAGVCDTDRILEPSAGTGAILRAVRQAAPSAHCDAVEQNYELADYIRKVFPDISVIHTDFLKYSPDIGYDKILMNPPFNRAIDIKHITHALTMLSPGGVLTAVCLNGPRQERALRPLADTWEALPQGTFAYTSVGTVILRISQ